MKTKGIIITVILFLLTILNVNAEVLEGKCGENLTFSFDDDTDILTIMGVGDMTDYKAADVVPWNKVVGQIKKVEMKEGVTSVGNYAFYGCELLWNVKMPSTVTRIGDYAFGACLYLFNIDLPEDLTSVGAYAFLGCSNFKEFTFPKKVQEIGAGVLYGCSSIETVDIKCELTTIPAYAFDYCSSLKSINIPSTVTAIGGYAFHSCEALPTLKLPGELLTIGEYAFYNCKALDKVVLPEKLTTIGTYGFGYCSNLGAINIPSGVKSLPNYTFYSCSSLKNVEMNIGLTTIGHQAFINCTSLDNVVIPRSVTSMSTYVFYGCTSLSEIVIPDGLTTLPDYTFYGCTSLSKVHLPNTLTSVEAGAFINCTSLTEIDLPASICTIGGSAFQGATALSVMKINRVKDPLPTLGNNALQKVPDSLVIIVPCGLLHEYQETRDWAPYASNFRADDLKFKVTVSTNNKAYGTVAHAGVSCGRYSAVDTLYAKPLDGYEFLNWNDGNTMNPRPIEVTKDVTYKANFGKLTAEGKCGDNLYWKLNGSGVLTIYGSGPMYDFKTHGSVWYEHIGAIKSVVVEPGAASIGKNAFENCKLITSLSLPTSVKELADSAFYGCTSLKSIGLPSETEAKIGASGFPTVPSTFVLYVPCNLTEAYKASAGTNTYAKQIKALDTFYKVTLKTNDATLGSVKLVGRVCEDGVIYDTIVATPSAGNYFSHWADDASNAHTTRVVKVTGNVTYTAIFANKIDGGQCGDDLYWEYTSDGYLIIKGNGDMNSFTDVADVPWAKHLGDIKHIAINEGVTMVGNYSFFGCSNATDVSFPSTLKTIGSYAFYSCMELQEVQFPESLKTLGAYSFNGCASLRSIVIPSSVTSMGNYVFQGCTLMEKAVVNASIKSLPAYTFCHNNALTEVVLPADLTSIGNYAFYRCFNLPEINIPQTVTSIGVYAFYSCRSLKEINLPEKLGSLGYYSLANCVKLKKVVIPANVMSVQDGLCYGDSLLTEVVIPEVATSINASAFYGCVALTKINFPVALATISSSAFRGCKSLNNLSLPANIQTLGEAAFYDCTGLTNINLPSGLVSIGKNTFYGCTGLTNMVIPTRVLTLGETAFGNCSSLETLLLQRREDALTAMGLNTFRNTPQTLTIYVPCSRVDDYKALSSWSTQVDRMVSDVDFYKVTLKSSDEKLGTVSHSGSFCDLTSVRDSLYATVNANSTFLKWSDGVTENPRLVTLDRDTTFLAEFIGILGRGKCGDNLTWELDSRGILTISGTGKMYDFVAGLSSWASFADEVKTVVINKGAVSVGDNAFNGCTNLKTVTLASTVNSIGKGTFANCKGVESIYCNGNKVVTIDKTTFVGASAAMVVYVPCGLLETYQKNSVWSAYAKNLKSYGDLYELTVLTNDEKLGVAQLEGVECADNQLVGSMKAMPIEPNHFSFWSDDEDLEDTLRVMPFNSDTTVTAVFASVIAEGQCGAKLFWTFDTQGKLEITGTGNMYNFSSSSPAGWSSYVGQIKRVYIEEGATSVGNNAFYACTNLKKVRLPESLTSIGQYSFNGCSGLKAVNLPTALKTLSHYAFYGCSSLTSVYVPGSVTTMGNYSFAMCPNLEKVTIDTGLVTLPEYVFNGCTSLKYVSLPNTLTTIARNAFSGCRALDSIRIPENVATIATYAFNGCVALKSIEIPYGLATISDYTFYNCTALEKVVLPPTVRNLGVSAFNGCSALNDISLPFSISTIGNSCFRYCSSLQHVSVPNGVSMLGDYVFADCPKLSYVFIPNTVTALGSYSFYNCSSLTRVAVPSTITKIGSYAFGYCSKLDTLLIRRYQDPLTALNTNGLVRTSPNLNVYLPCSRYEDYMVDESWKAFQNRMYMESFLYRIALYPNYKSRGSAAVVGTGCSDSVSVDTIMAFPRSCGQFSHWSDGVTENPRVLRVTSDSLLEAIFIADTVIHGTVGDLKWTLYCDSLLVIDGEGNMPDFKSPKDVPWYPYRNMIVYGDVQNGVRNIGNYAFYNDTLLLGITLPQSLTKIGDKAFAQCVAMDTITIPSSVKSIGKYAFAESGLNFVNIPEGVKLGTAMLANCKDLGYVYMPNTYTALADSMFAGCSALKQAPMPTSLNYINRFAFMGCSSLESLTLPDSLLEIRNSAFVNCSSLHKVTFPDNLEVIGQSAFYACPAIDTVECLRVEGSIPSLGSRAFDGEAEERTIFVDCNKLMDYRNDANWGKYKSNISTYGLMYTANLTVSADTAGTVELVSTWCDESGTRDSIVATPIDCHRFLRWSDGVIENPRVITLNKDTNLVAIFRIGYIDMGLCGENVEWELSCDSTLKIMGTGAMANYSAENPAPWAGYNEIIKGVQIADGITAIGNSAFADAGAVEKVTLPSSVVFVGSNAFAGCHNLNTIRVEADKVPVADSSSFADIRKDFTIYVPCVLQDDYEQANGWNAYAGSFAPLKTPFVVKVEFDETLGTVTSGPLTCIDTLTAVNFVAKPIAGALLAGWESGEKVTERVANIVSDTVIKAIFVPDTFKVDGLADGSGKVLGAGRYPFRQKATLTAEPAKGYHFVKWNTGNTNAVIDTVVLGNVSLTATFAIDTCRLTVIADGRGEAYESGKYLYGETATLRAKADELHHLVMWSNGSKDTLLTMKVTSDTVMTAYFAIDSFRVAVKAENGTVSGADLYPYGATASLEAVPDFGYHFTKWANGRTAAAFDTVVGGDILVEPLFEINTYTLNVLADGNGQVAGGGKFLHGEKAAISAVPDYGFRFVKWSNGRKVANDTITMVSDSTLTGIFSVDTVLVETVAENGKILGGGEYLFGDEVTLNAVADSGYHFLAWADGSTIPTTTFKVLDDTVVTAQFAIDTFVVELAATNGSTTGAGKYLFGETAHLTAIADANYHFMAWSNGATTVGIDLLINSNVSMEAFFAPDTFTVHISMGDSIVSEPHVYGDTVHLSFVPVPGHHFLGWNNGATTPETDIRVEGDTTLFPILEKDTFYIGGLAVNGVVEGTGYYAYKDTARLTAVANAGYHFLNWENGVTDSVLAYEVLGSDTLTAYFAVDSVYVTIADSANVTGATSGYYLYGDSIHLAAVPTYGYRFKEWNNGLTTEKIGIRLTGDTTLFPIFELDSFYIDAIATSGGVTEGSGYYAFLDVAHLSAKADSGYHFMGWNTGNSNSELTLPVVGNYSFVAIFGVDSFLVDIPTADCVGDTGKAYRALGDSLHVTALEKEGHRFIGWNTGDTAHTIGLRVEGDTVIYPIYERNLYRIDVVSPYGYEGDTCGYYAYGDTLYVEAGETVGRHFVKWTNGATTMAATYVVPAHDDTLMAVYERDAILVKTLPTENGKVFGGGWYMYGDTVRLRVVGNEGYKFSKWTDESLGNDAELVFVLTEPIEVTAEFVVDEDYMFDVFDVTGRLYKQKVLRSNALDGLPNGTYILNNGHKCYKVMKR
ncbi:MAG: leucine-rich repeat protein [Paludibacteraceae bacterium]|nr:leucine-rich repeat protein [Paludibacteraceae bacterium]